MSSLIGTERRPDGSVELHLTGAAGSVVGLALAALTTLPVVLPGQALEVAVDCS